MSTWTNVTDTVLEPGQPIRSVDIIAIKNNILAVPAGAANAPRVQTAAIQNSAVTTAKIANANVTSAKLNIANRSFSGLLGAAANITIVSNDVASFSPRLTTSQNNQVAMGGLASGGTGSRKLILNTVAGATRNYAVTWSYVA